MSRTGKEAEEEKGVFRVHKGAIPTGTSENTNYLPYLSLCIREGTRTRAHCHSYYSVRIYFSNFILRNVTCLCHFGSRYREH